MTSTIKEIRCEQCEEREELCFQVFTKNNYFVLIEQDGSIIYTDDEEMNEKEKITKQLSKIDFKRPILIQCHGSCNDQTFVSCEFEDGTTSEDEEEIFKKVFME